MNPLGPGRFAVVAGVVALATGVATFVVTVRIAPSALPFAVLGWAVTAGTGVVGGAWMVARHGVPGTPFLKALAACILARLLLGAAGAIPAALRGTEAMVAYAAGLAAGYLPVQILEMVWFHRRSSTDRPTRRVTIE